MSSVPPGKRLLFGSSPPSAPLSKPLSNDEVPIELESIPPSADSLPPDDLEPDMDDVVLRWGASLDALDYFTLLRLEAATSDSTTEAQVRAAFHAFALAFHPDRYRGAPDDVRDSANRVYCLGAEAYRVLLDPLLRRRYVRSLAQGLLRMPPEEIADSTRNSGETTLADLVKSAAARPFAVRADELIAAGDWRQARLQLRLALTKEPHNARLEEKLRELDERVTRPTSS